MCEEVKLLDPDDGDAEYAGGREGGGNGGKADRCVGNVGDTGADIVSPLERRGFVQSMLYDGDEGRE